MKDEIKFVVHGYDGRDYDMRQHFIDLPPADPICFNMAKLAEPTLTYQEFVRRWQENTFKIRNGIK